MPQMQPMMWLLMFLLFSAILMIYNIMNYYINAPMNIYNKNLINNNIILNKWMW